MPARKGTRPPNAGKGRKKGVPNKATRDVREAVAELVQGNVENLQLWLEDVGRTNPARAFELVLKLMEYHIPKLARTELTLGPPDEIEDMYELTDAELMAIIVEDDPKLEARARRRAQATKRRKGQGNGSRSTSRS